MHIPRGAEREYIALLGICAIYVAVLPIGPAFIGVSRDLHQSYRSLQRRWTGAEIAFTHWVKDRNRAEAIRRRARQYAPSAGAPIQLYRAIVDAAAALNVRLTSHTTVSQRVAIVVKVVEDGIARAQREGELTHFNQYFRQWRLQARTQGRTMSYAEARARLRHTMLAQLADRHDGVELKSVLPELPDLAKVCG